MMFKLSKEENGEQDIQLEFPGEVRFDAIHLEWVIASGEYEGNILAALDIDNESNATIRPHHWWVPTPIKKGPQSYFLKYKELVIS